MIFLLKIKEQKEMKWKNEKKKDILEIENVDIEIDNDKLSKIYKTE